MRKRGFLINILLLFCSVCFALLVVELVARYLPSTLIPEKSTRKSNLYRPDIGVITRGPNTESVHSNPWVFNTIRYNGYGFRGDVVPLEKKSGEFRIALLGDSYIEGREVKDRELVSSVLARFLGDNVRIMNFGLSGTSQAEQILIYRNLVRHFEPDMVIHFVTVSNDFEDNVRELALRKNKNFLEIEDGRLVILPPPLYARILLSPGINRLTEYLTNSATFRLIYHTIARRTQVATTTAQSNPFPAAENEAAENPVPSVSSGDTLLEKPILLLTRHESHAVPAPSSAAPARTPAPSAKSLGNYRDDEQRARTAKSLDQFQTPVYDKAKALMAQGLLTLRDECVRDGAVFVLTHATACWLFMKDVHPRKRDLILERYHWLETFARKHDFKYIDLKQSLVTYQQDNKLPSTFFHILWDGHWAPTGHRIVAERIALYVRNSIPRLAKVVPAQRN